MPRIRQISLFSRASINAVTSGSSPVATVPGAGARRSSNACRSPSASISRWSSAIAARGSRRPRVSSATWSCRGRAAGPLMRWHVPSAAQRGTTQSAVQAAAPGSRPIASLRETPNQELVLSVVDEDLGCGRLIGGLHQPCPVARRNLLWRFAARCRYSDGLPRRHRQRGNLTDGQARPEPVAPRPQFISKDLAEPSPLGRTRYRLRVPLVLGKRQVELQRIENDCRSRLPKPYRSLTHSSTSSVEASHFTFSTASGTSGRQPGSGSGPNSTPGSIPRALRCPRNRWTHSRWSRLEAVD